MKTFEQALEEESREQENHVFRMEPWKEITHSDSFKIGAQWAIQNLHLLDVKDLLKHEDVKKLVKALKATANVAKNWHGVDAWDIYKDHSPEMRLYREALKPFEDET